MTTTTARTYRFSDSQRPGLLLGLSGRQAIPRRYRRSGDGRRPADRACHRSSGSSARSSGIVIAFGQMARRAARRHARARHSTDVEASDAAKRWVAPAARRRQHRQRPAHAAARTRTDRDRPTATARGIAFVRDRQAGTLTVALRIHGHGFPLASAAEQDTMLASWAAALSPFARERSPITSVAWHEWAHPVTSAAHADFLDTIGIATRTHRPGRRRLPGADRPASTGHRRPRRARHRHRQPEKIRARRSSPSRLQGRDRSAHRRGPAVHRPARSRRAHRRPTARRRRVVRRGPGAVRPGERPADRHAQPVARRGGDGGVRWSGGRWSSNPNGRTPGSTVRTTAPTGSPAGRNCRSGPTG